MHETKVTAIILGNDKISLSYVALQACLGMTIQKYHPQYCFTLRIQTDLCSLYILSISYHMLLQVKVK